MHLARIVTITLVLAALAIPGAARTKKGDDFLKQGREAEVRKEYDKALELYEKALLEDPGDAAYQIAARRVRFQAGMTRVDLGQRLRQEGRLEEALAEFQRAYAIDPALGIADQEIRRTRELIEQRKAQPKTGEAGSPEKPVSPGEEAAERESQERLARMRPLPELKPITSQIQSLKMNNQPVRVLYETVGKLAGINVVMDPEFQQGARSTFTVDLSNTTLDEALDHLAIITKTYWKPLSANAIFVTNDNVTKRRDYEDYVVKVFYVKNATTVQELQEIATTIRSIAEIRRAFTYNAMNAIMVRDTADKVALAEKLIYDLDKPKSEVVVDVIVMQADRQKIREYAVALQFGGEFGLNAPIVFNRGTTPPANGGDDDDDDDGSNNSGNLLPITAFRNIRLFGDFSTVVPGALVQALADDSDTRTLQQPQLRAVSNQKATLHIGDKVPYASGSFTPLGGAVGQGISSYAQTQFQFAEVGVKVDLTPQVHGRDEISMHVEVDISNVSGEVEQAGLTQPIISTRKVVHDIRLREGEVNLLGGLMSEQEIHAMKGIPGLIRIPILKYLFGGETNRRLKGELLIALIPHIVRAPDYDDINRRGISAGSDATVKLTYGARTQLAPAPAAAETTPPATPAPATPPVETPPAAPPAQPSPTPEAAAATPGAPTRLTFIPPAVQATAGAPFTVTLQIENAVDLFTAPMRIKFDPKMVRLTNVRQAGMIGADGQRINFSENTLNDIGEAVITLNRIPGSGGISGSGPLLQLTFQPVARGTTQISLTEITLRNTQLQPVAVPLPAINVTVQ
jgi:general secretion pathway protein D